MTRGNAEGGEPGKDFDSGIVTYDDGSTQTCDNVIDEQEMRAMFYGMMQRVILRKIGH